MTEENITFEQRWEQLLIETREQLTHLNQQQRSVEICGLWTAINKYVTIMAVPKTVLPKARRTLMQLVLKAPFSLKGSLLLYTLMTFLPRNWYRNAKTQRWFKQRLTKI